MPPPAALPTIPAPRHQAAGWKNSLRTAFTLVEMLVVMLVIVVLLSLTTPLIRGVFTGRNVGDGLDAVTGYLSYARTQAVTQNTYVLVGFYQAKGSDDLQIASIISVNGTFDPTQFTSSTPTYNASYPALGNIVHANNVTLVPANQLTTAMQNKLTAAQAVPDGNTIVQCSDTDPTKQGALYFSNGAKDSSSNAIPFRSVIAFSPQGEALFFVLAPTSITSALPFYSQLFIGVRATRGGAVVQNDQNSAAITIDGGSGDIKVFRQ